MACGRSCEPLRVGVPFEGSSAGTGDTQRNIMEGFYA
jgi:hypothetical protein